MGTEFLLFQGRIAGLLGNAFPAPESCHHVPWECCLSSWPGGQWSSVWRGGAGTAEGTRRCGQETCLSTCTAERLRQAPVLKPAAGEESGRCPENRYRTSNPGSKVTETKPIIYTASRTQGGRGGKDRKMGCWGGVLQKDICWSDMAIVFMSPAKLRFPAQDWAH